MSAAKKPTSEALADRERTERVKCQDHAHVFHTWSAQAEISPLPVAGGKGSYFWDYEGNRYLDFASQLVNVNLGHQHPRLIAAIKRRRKS